jgi:pyrroline-5-carboxylate reductase
MGRAVTGGAKRLPVIGGAPLRGESPGFHRIAIVGLGAVGGSLAMAVRQAWPQALVIGVDTHAVIEAAIRLHAIDVGSDDLMIAGDADLVVLAGGPEEDGRVLPYLAEAIAGESVVLAIGDGPALAEGARGLPARLPVVSGLPSVDIQSRGIQAASAGLFCDRPWTIASVSGPVDAVARVRVLVEAIGGLPGGDAASA